jgi:hypothetical protein
MRVGPALLAFLSVTLAACFDDPVTETLVIQMLEEERVALTATVALQYVDQDGPLPLRTRLQGLKQDYLSGQDPWTRRFERSQFVHEERTVFRDRHDASVKGRPPYTELDVAKIRHMVVIQQDDLGFVLGDSGAAFRVFSSRGTAEMLVVPGAGSLATPEQRRVLERHLAAWSASAARYLEETRRLYAYLATAPDRATACFAVLFEDLVEKEGPAYPLLDGEKELLDPVRKAMETMAENLGGLADVPYGLNELSYLVYDPLPAAITVCLPKPAEEIEGFVPKGELCHAIPRRGIIDAFDGLEGRWISPDPFVTWIRVHRSQGQEKLDLERFAAKERSVRSLPSPAEIVKALEDGMRHQPAYRLRWIETNAR